MSKASLESLARTMSVAVIAAFGIFSIQQINTLQPTAAASTVSKSDAATELRGTERASRSVRYTFTAKSAPKSVKMRGIWVKAVLREAGFRGKSLKEAWAIVMRESTGRPLAYNGNRSTGDSSYGLFQINMLGSLGPDRREKFGLKSNNELFDPITNAKAAYYMSAKGTNWSAWEPYNGGYKERGFRKWLKMYPA